jgi:excinuclease ABC subunit C
MRELGIDDVPVVGLAKEEEIIYLSDAETGQSRSFGVFLPRSSPALFLVQRIRDEAHRFAVTYHRTVRGKRGLGSALDDIPGVGPKRKRALLRQFGSLRGIREATVDQLAAVPGMTAPVAEALRRALGVTGVVSTDGKGAVSEGDQATAEISASSLSAARSSST